MQSRRDQVQAYFFVVSRLVSAVVHGRPDSLNQPNRRMNTGTFLGVIIGAVIMGVFGIIGVFAPGGNESWRQQGAIVMNQDTGARYVYLDDQLRPVLNYSSARLATGGGGQVHEVSQSSLSGTPVGQPIGIHGAPDALPSAGALIDGPWTVCAQEAGTDPRPTGPTATLMLGRPFKLAPTGQRALLMRGPDRSMFLVWQGKRHRIPGGAEATALGYGGVDPVEVTAAWLNPIPQGRDFDVPRDSDLGRAGPEIDGRQSVVGQLYLVDNPALGTGQLYLVRMDGVAPLSRTTAALLLAAPFTEEAYGGSAVRPVEVGPGGLAGVPLSNGGHDLVDGLPEVPPELVAPGQNDAMCVAVQPVGGGELRVHTGLLPATVHEEAIPVAAHEAGVTADRVLIPAGSGVLAREQATPEVAFGALYLVTETGMKFPLADAKVPGMLGYSADTATAVPGELLALLPTGPVLSEQGARNAQEPAGS